MQNLRKNRKNGTSYCCWVSSHQLWLLVIQSNYGDTFSTHILLIHVSYIEILQYIGFISYIEITTQRFSPSTKAVLPKPRAHTHIGYQYFITASSSLLIITNYFVCPTLWTRPIACNSDPILSEGSTRSTWVASVIFNPLEPDDIGISRTLRVELVLKVSRFNWECKRNTCRLDRVQCTSAVIKD